MRNTTLCYIERGEQYLMLHRVKKEHDLNHDKWVGIGGKFEADETPDECLLREAYEETGLTLTDWRCRGVVTFLSDEWEGEYMYLFTASGFTGTLRECDEGDLEWVDKTAVPSLPLWAGDKIFFRLLAEDAPFFSLKLVYRGEELTAAELETTLPGPPRARTTLLTLLARLEEKDCVTREKQGRGYLYTAALTRAAYLPAESRSLWGRLFGGSPRNFVAALAETDTLTDADIDELAEYLEELKKERK